MVRGMFVAAMAIGLAQAARAQDPPFPKTGAPEYQIATAREHNGGVLVKFSRIGYKDVVKEVDEEVNGKKVKVRKSFLQAAWESDEFYVDGKQVAVVGKDGKPIDVKDLPRRLSKPTPVVYFGFAPVTGNPTPSLQPDPFYLQYLSDDIVAFAAVAEAWSPRRRPQK